MTNMHQMFQGAEIFNQDISGWNVANVSDFRAMFRDALQFNQNLARWDFRSTGMASAGADAMFDGSGLSSQNYSTLLNALRINPNLKQNVHFGAVGTCYLNGASAAHAYLKNDLKWTISDDGQCP